ncbi:hypothetical protein HDV00_001817, partial [Rhizophlyctis rosea]
DVDVSSTPSVDADISTASSILDSSTTTSISAAHDNSIAMSEATHKTGKIYQSGFVQGFKAQNRNDIMVLGEELLFDDPQTGNTRGDVDFAVVATRPKTLREFFPISCLMAAQTGDMVVQKGAQIFLELTSMDGKGIVQRGRLRAKYSFYQDFVAGSLKPTVPAAPVWNRGDIVVFAYNGVDHVSIEKEVEQLHAGFIFVPVWLPKNTVAAWEASVRADEERVRADEERVRAAEERVRAEEERVRAEEERVRAEEERVRAEEERVRAEEATALVDRSKKVIRQLFIDQGKTEEEISLFLAAL